MKANVSNKCKAFTSLEQSRELAEILPLESADMCYIKYSTSDNSNWEFNENFPPMILGDMPIDKMTVENLPCWSLAALINILPNSENISTNLSKGGYRISTLEYTNSWFVDYEDETNGLNNCVTSADNPVDACVAMIEKLHERNLL